MTRFCLDNTIKIVCRILHTGLGQPAQNPPSLLHQLRIVAGGILPDGHMQLGRLQEHHPQQWSPLHCLGHPSKAASQVPWPQRFQKNVLEQPPFCQKVQAGWSRSWQDRQAASEETPRTVQLWWLVLWGWKNAWLLFGFAEPKLWCSKAWTWFEKVENFDNKNSPWKEIQETM